jgi:hypothetical protein
MKRAAVCAALFSLWLGAACSDDGGVSQDAGPSPDGQQLPDGPEVCEELLPERFPEDTVLEAGCYLCQKTPIIGGGVTLTMQPGVKIVFFPETGLNFSADQVLIAAGTAVAPIIFTGSEKVRGHWKGLSLDGTLQPDSILDHVTIEYAGNTNADRDAAAVKLTSDSRGVRLSITNTTVRQSQGWGLYLGGAAVVGAFSGNTLTGNTLGPAYVGSEVVNVLDAGSTYQGNDRDEVVVEGRTTMGSWAAIDVPYYVESSIGADGDWTIEAGNTLIMAADSLLSISGDASALIAQGTAAKPILFTGETKARGAWRGIFFDGSNNTRNTLAHVTVEYAGNTGADRDMAAVKLGGDSHGVQVKMTDTTIKESQGWGLYLTGSALLPGFANNTLTKNTLGPISAGSEAVHQLLPTSTYVGNDLDRIVVRDGSVSQTVTWSDLDAPYLIKNNLEPNHAVLTLAPGVTLLMDANSYIAVGGNDSWLRAVGTAAAPITIRGAEEVAGFWQSIFFDNTEDNPNALDYCNIAHGGGGAARGWYGMIVATSDSRGVQVSVNNSTIQDSSQYCIWKVSVANVSVSGSTFARCASGDIFTQP